ncbi:hypothetical protein PCE1_004159 [Barthelona sp. PCE]
MKMDRLPAYIKDKITPELEIEVTRLLHSSETSAAMGQLMDHLEGLYFIGRDEKKLLENSSVEEKDLLSFDDISTLKHLEKESESIRRQEVQLEKSAKLSRKSRKDVTFEPVPLCIEVDIDSTNKSVIPRFPDFDFNKDQYIISHFPFVDPEIFELFTKTIDEILSTCVIDTSLIENDISNLMMTKVLKLLHLQTAEDTDESLLYRIRGELKKACDDYSVAYCSPLYTPILLQLVNKIEITTDLCMKYLITVLRIIIIDIIRRRSITMTLEHIKHVMKGFKEIYTEMQNIREAFSSFEDFNQLIKHKASKEEIMELINQELTSHGVKFDHIDTVFTHFKEKAQEVSSAYDKDIDGFISNANIFVDDLENTCFNFTNFERDLSNFNNVSEEFIKQVDMLYEKRKVLEASM